MLTMHGHDFSHAVRRYITGKPNRASLSFHRRSLNMHGMLQTQWVFVGFCFLFFDFFSLGILPVSWMYASEIMPLRTRNKGVALGVGAHWLSNFVVVYVTPQAIDNLGYQLYIIWAVLNASFVPITWFFYPETARRSLEDMDAIFLAEGFGMTMTRSPGLRTAGGDDVIDDDVDKAEVFEREIMH